MGDTVQITRRELHDELWRTPATKVAAKYGISDVGLAKVCQRHNIPKPGPGYWAQVAHGTAAEPDLLPSVDDPELEDVSFTTGHSGNNTKKEVYPAVPVAMTLTRPHPLIAASLAQLKASKVTSEGLAHSYGPNAIPIAVTTANIGRATRIMDAFLKAVESHDFQLVVSKKFGRDEIGIVKGTQSWPFKLREHLKRTAVPLNAYEQEYLKKYGYTPGNRYTYLSNGQLELNIGEDYWHPIIVRDSTRNKLEEKIGHAVGRLCDRFVEEQERLQKLAAEHAERKRIEEEQRRRKAEAERLRKEEQQRVQKVENEISRRQMSCAIREYLLAIKEVLNRYSAQPSAGGPFDQWLTWMEAYATRVDPLSELVQELEGMHKRGELPTTPKSSCAEP